MILVNEISTAAWLLESLDEPFRDKRYELAEHYQDIQLDIDFYEKKLYTAKRAMNSLINEAMDLYLEEIKKGEEKK